MKKILILALLVVPCVVMGQTITCNTKSGDSHIVITDKEICRSFTDRMVLSVGLSGIKQENSKNFYFLDLKITSAGQITMAAGSALTITLGNGEEIKLVAADNTIEGMVRDIYAVNGLITHDYSAYPTFPISEQQINAIISSGVKKVICNTSPNAYSKEFKKDKVGKALSERWKLLKKSL